MKLVNRFLSLVILATLFVLALSACGVAVPPAQPVNGFAASLVAMPPEGSQLIVVLVTAGVTWLLLQLSTALKIDLGGYVQQIVAIVSPILITLAESALGMIPPAFDNIVLTVIHLLVLIAGSLGVVLVANKTKAKQVHALLK
jgi:hypothetical protein